MKLAYDAGVNFFDNAESYAKGASETVMGEILKKMKWPRDSYLISSKAFFGAGGNLPTQTGLHRKHLVEACDAALKRLQLEYLDLYFCHRPDKSTPIEETVWTMHNLIQQGKVFYWGTSEWSAQEIMEAHMVARQNNLIGPVMEQPQYNFFWREKMEAEYLQMFKTVGLGTTIWSPLLSGVLTGKYNKGFPKGTRLGLKGLEWLKNRSVSEDILDKTRKLTALSGKLGMTMSQLAIAWCARNPDVSTVILGASKPVQLRENLDAIRHMDKLDEVAMEKIEKILGNKPKLPPY